MNWGRSQMCIRDRLNSTHPQDAETRRLRESLEKQYGVPVMAVDALNMREEDINALLESVLFEFCLLYTSRCV